MKFKTDDDDGYLQLGCFLYNKGWRRAWAALSSQRAQREVQITLYNRYSSKSFKEVCVKVTVVEEWFGPAYRKE